jgi:asparagine synthase (glutamine-hydrolysing)
VVGNGWLSNETALWRKLDKDDAVCGEEVYSDSPIAPDSSRTMGRLVAALWERWGMECLVDLEGMFALVVWDVESRTSWLVRDRVGTCPLYYTRIEAQPFTCWISSHLRALNPWRSPDIDPVALRDYLCCAFVPGERTLWRDVRELRPGTCLRLPDHHTVSYWHPQEHITGEQASLNWHGERLRSLLNTVVQDYLPANNPVGVYLSGGLDSSCITALAAQFHDHPIHTYSIHFGANCPNELEFSGKVAHHCQTQHHCLEITPKTMWDRLPDTMAALDDPIGDPLTVPNRLMAEAARQQVQVILNGEGGDPCFGGPKNQPMLLTQLYGETASGHPSPNSAPSSLSSPVFLADERVTAYLTSFQKCATDLPNLLKPDLWQHVQQEPSVFAGVLQSHGNYLNRLMLLNIAFKGADHILTKVNNLTRAAGVMGRSPLFDQRVVDMSLQVPPIYKLSGAEEKAVLKCAMADLLPEAILKRPKSGMMVPVQLWFRDQWNRQARSVLLNRKAAIAPYLNQSVIKDWLNYRGDVWGRYGVKLWLILSLEWWLQANQNHQSKG